MDSAPPPPAQALAAPTCARTEVAPRPALAQAVRLGVGGARAACTAGHWPRGGVPGGTRASAEAAG